MCGLLYWAGRNEEYCNDQAAVQRTCAECELQADHDFPEMIALGCLQPGMHIWIMLAVQDLQMIGKQPEINCGPDLV